MEQQANELTPQQAISGKQVNVVILTRMGHNQTKDIIDLINTATCHKVTATLYSLWSGMLINLTNR